MVFTNDVIQREKLRTTDATKAFNKQTFSIKRNKFFGTVRVIIKNEIKICSTYL